MPFFTISFGGPYFPKMLFRYDGKVYKQDELIIPMESLHVYGTKDEYREFMKAHTLYSKEAIIIYHDEGHKFPRSLHEPAKLTAFIGDQY